MINGKFRKAKILYLFWMDSPGIDIGKKVKVFMGAKWKGAMQSEQ